MKRSNGTSGLPVIFGISRFEAAAAIGISAILFDTLVEAGQMPKPRRIDTQRVWDVDELRAAFKLLPYDGESKEHNTWDDLT
jgi:hypothetical protein